MTELYPIGNPAPQNNILNYTATIQNAAGHSYTWNGQQATATPQGVPLTTAQLTTMTNAMAADILNQILNGSTNGAPSYAQQKINNDAHG
jgi:hypothetical protein